MNGSENLFEIVLFTKNSTVSATYRLHVDQARVMHLAHSLTTASEVVVIQVYLGNLKIHEWSRPPLEK